MKKYIKIYIILFAMAAASLSGCLFDNKAEGSNGTKTIFVVSMTADEMSNALKNKSIEGFLSWEPNPSKAIVEGYGRNLANSRDVWENHPSCVLAVSEDLKDENMITALVWAEVRGTRYINDPKNREKVLDYAQEYSGLKRDMVSAAINNTVYIEYPDLKETRNAIDILTKAGVFKRNVTSLGYKDEDDFLSNVYIDKYYRYVKINLDKDPDWIPPVVNGSLRFGFIEGNSHYLAMFIAKKEGYFEKVGLIEGKNLQLAGYRSGRAITEALNQQEIDAAVGGTTVLLRYKINDNGRIRIVNGVNSGGSSLVVRNDSNISSIEDLNGKKIATPGFGTCQDTIMRKLFEGYEIKTQ